MDVPMADGWALDGRPSEIALSRDRSALRTMLVGCIAVSMSGSIVDARVRSVHMKTEESSRKTASLRDL